MSAEVTLIGLAVAFPVVLRFILGLQKHIPEGTHKTPSRRSQITTGDSKDTEGTWPMAR